MAGACKWVHETHTIPEYVVDVSILEKLNVDSIMHGDDVVVNESGESIYTPFINLGKYREYKRTQGISTTDITDRIINLENPDFFRIDVDKNQTGNRAKRFHATISKIVQFFDDRSINKFATGKKVVYVTGNFDILR
jgi:ethanolamine-phosphate cytidylyltransferase